MFAHSRVLFRVFVGVNIILPAAKLDFGILALPFISISLSLQFHTGKYSISQLRWRWGNCHERCRVPTLSGVGKKLKLNVSCPVAHSFESQHTSTLSEKCTSSTISRLRSCFSTRLHYLFCTPAPSRCVPPPHSAGTEPNRHFPACSRKLRLI